MANGITAASRAAVRTLAIGLNTRQKSTGARSAGYAPAPGVAQRGTIVTLMTWVRRPHRRGPLIVTYDHGPAWLVVM